MKRLVPILLAATLLTACGKKSQCVSDLDCFSGEVCLSDGVCGTPWGADAGSDAAAGDDGGTTTDDDGGTTTDDDGGTSDDEDAGENSNTTMMDAGSDVTTQTDAEIDMGPTGPCVADPFDQCEDDEDPDNNAFPGEQATNMTRGCQSSGFEPLDMTIEGRVCPLDPMDMYEFLVVECDEDEGSFVVEAILDVEEDCDPDTIAFDVGGVGASCEDPGDRVQCETLDDGRRRISVLYPGTSNAVVGSIRFFVETPDRMDLKFDYDLQLIVRR